jgi:N-acetylmuramoyl-L-alanine amidase
VAIDPAHGGADAGVRFSDKLIEKDVTLEIAEKIKAELTKLGISSIVLRTADEDRGTDERAEIANGAHVSFYVGVHAGQSGTGVRLYTAMPTSAQPQHGFMPWEQAQATFSDRSVAFSAALASQLNAKKVAARQLAGNTAPITHVAAAAVSIEVAPQDRDEDASLESQPYQQRVAQAVAAAIAGERSR